MRDEFSSSLIEKLAKFSEREILSGEKDGRYFAALSAERVNAVEWFPFERYGSVLQAGAEYGAFLPLAGKVPVWDVFDDAPEALDVVRARMAASELCPQVRLLPAAPESHYDVLFFASFPGKERAERLIRGTSPRIVLALAENAAALRFVSGVGKEPGRYYASAEELESLAACCEVCAGAAGKAAESAARVKTYYPLPSAEFARDIYSDTKLPGPGSFRGVSGILSEEGVAACDEEALYDSLTAADPALFCRYAPAFLCVIGGDGLPDYIRYNSTRNAEYAIRTELYTGKKSVKTALCPEADSHVAAFEKRYELLSAGVPGGLEVLRPQIIPAGNAAEEEASAEKKAVSGSGRTSAVFAFAEGVSFGRQLAAEIADGKAPAEKMEACILRMIGKENEREQYNLDILFDNVLEKDGRLTLIDYEWTSEEPLPYRFVRYRILRYFYEDNARSLTAYDTLAGFLRAFGFSGEEQSRWEKQEDAFQDSVFGRGSGHLRDRYRREAGSVAGIREQARRMFADEIDELKTTLQKEREVERLSQQHIRNIENINKDLKAQIDALKAENVRLRQHQSLFGKLKERTIRKLDAWAPADSRRRLVLKYIRGTLRHPAVYFKRYFTRAGHNYIRGNFAIRGEFSEGGILQIPAVADGERPLVSIVIPAYNQAAYTYACIRSVLDHTDFAATPFEVILADDASTDATAEITNWIPGLKVARTGGNLGFLRNCNQAAAGARGRYLFFLNNDTKVTDGWLSSLTALMERDAGIGMCGSKLVYPDGRLQEAGGIIWSDGSGWNYGRMDDPEKCCYNYVRDVDYISGAAILIRTELWKEIGGFDERYAPAYCEDSDLAFEVRRHGKRVVYQPDSVVVHFEGVSNGTDVNGTGLKRYQTVNQEKFREKWAEELKEQSVNTGNPNPFAARERSQKKTTVLVIDHYVPQRDRDAGSKTTFQYLKLFTEKGFSVKFLGDDFRHEEPYTHELQQMGIEVLYGEEMRLGIFDWLKTNREFIDIAYLNRPHIAVKYMDFLRENTGIRCIFYGHDLHSLRIRREFELTGDIRKRREAEYWKGIEYQVMEKADMVYYPSQEEIDEIHARRPGIPAKAITAYIYDKDTEQSADGTSGEDRSAAEGLLFVGGFKHPPNADGVLWFIKEIWPQIRRELPELRFRVAGSHPTEELLELSGKEGVEVLGFVPDAQLEELYRKSRIVVVPLRYGAGVKGKVVEALDRDCAIVTTSVGAEGIPGADTAMVIADLPEEFARSVVNLYTDSGELERRRAADGALIREHYSTEAVWKIIAPDFEVRKDPV